MDRIESLSITMRSLSQERAEAMAEYDAAPDGSQQKRDAVRRMAALGDEIREIEDELSDLADQL